MSDFEGYETNDEGIIVSPGKFEGEPTYVLRYWEASLNGMADEDYDDAWAFNIDDSDVATFPALRGWRSILLWEDSQGFVHHSLSRSLARVR